MVIALCHIVGAVFASIILSLLLLLLGAWEQERVQKRRMQDAAIALGVPLASLETDDNLVPRFLQYMSQRFSGELLRNRFSDLCGNLRAAWGWLSTLVQICILIGVGWSIYSAGASNAVAMWSVPVIGLVFWAASVAFSFACLLLTGRYPGEAKTARKAIADFLEQRNTSPSRETADVPTL